MTPPPATAELVESAEAEIEAVDTRTDGDDVIDLTDRRRVLLQVVFGVDVPPTSTDEVFGPSVAATAAGQS